MKISIIVIVALCVALCASKQSPRCKCLRTDSYVDTKLISEWISIDPKPYCKKVEVIVTLKNGREVCIKPNGEFHRFLVNVRNQRAQNAAMKSVRTIARSPSSTSSAQTLQTIVPSPSSTVSVQTLQTTTVTPAASTKE